ncbi:MAG: YidH family protein [Desulfonatronovibrionaceae bacterium]
MSEDERNFFVTEEEMVSEERVFLAEERNRYALERTLLANKRTFLAWTRTVLSLMGFGFVLEKLEVYLLKKEASEMVVIGVLAAACFALGALLISLVWGQFVLLHRKMKGGIPWAETILFAAILLVTVFFFVGNRAYISF